MENQNEMWNTLWPELPPLPPMHNNLFFQEVGQNHEHLHHPDNGDVVAMASGDVGYHCFMSEWEPLELEELLIMEDGQNSEHPDRPGNKDVQAVNLSDNSDETAAGHVAPPPLPPPVIPLDSEEYREYLKSRLQFECAAVAFIRENRAEPQNSAPADLPLLSPYGGGRMDSPNAQEDASRIVSKKSPQGKDKSSTTSGSRLHTLGEAERTRTVDGKHKRRIQNQEFARPSRERKLELGVSLEARVNQLRQKKSDLLKQLTDMLHNGNEEAVHIMFSETQVAILKAQVNMLEEMVKLATKFSYPSNIPAPGAPSTLSIL